MKIFIIIMSLFLFSCSSTDVKPIEIATECVEKTPLELQQPSELSLKTVQWYIITEDNYSAVFKQIETDGKDILLIGLTDDGYKNISLNYADIFKFIISQKQIIQSYKDYYEN